MNTFKYIWRFKNKNGLEDIKKARWYVTKAYETTNSAWRTNVIDDEMLCWSTEMYNRMNRLLENSALHGGFYGV